MPASAASLIDKGYLYKLLNNRVYVGEAVHKGTAYPGEHKAIISQALWDKVGCAARRAFSGPRSVHRETLSGCSDAR